MSTLEQMPSFVSKSVNLHSESRPSVYRKNLKRNMKSMFKDCAHQNMEMCRKVSKYWNYRYNLFSRFDEGIQMDLAGLYSVTPETIAKHQASRCKSRSTIVDAFTGIGGNAIQFALMGHIVIAIDINPQKIEYARHNAAIYGVEYRITFIVGDFFELAPTLRADIIFLSPPWGGPQYSRLEKYDLNMLQPKDGEVLFRVARNVADNIILFVPRNTDVVQLQALSQQTNNVLRCELEYNFIDGGLKGISTYYGPEFAREKRTPWCRKNDNFP